MTRYHGPSPNPLVNAHHAKDDICPVCNAHPGEPCRNLGGYVVPRHKRRPFDADAEKAQAWGQAWLGEAARKGY